MRTVLGVLAAVTASLVIPVGIIMLSVFLEPPPEAGDSYIRGAIGVAMFIPVFAVLLVLYHGLGIIAVRVLPIRPSTVLLVLSVLASAVFAALFLASGAPLSWDRLEAFGHVMASLWVMLALGSTIQYFICFKYPFKQKLK